LIYKKLIDRILDNLGIEDENAKTLKTVRNDIYDTLLEVFAKTRLPLKTFSFNVASTIESEEDFADTTYIDTLDIAFAVDSGSVASGYLSGNTPGFSVTNITSELTQIVLDMEALTAAPPSGGGTSVTVVTTDSKGVQVDNETVVFDETDGRHDITITLSLNDPVGGSLAVTTIKDALITSIRIYDATFTFNQNEQEMPADFVMPREVTFKNPSGRFYITYELTPEEFLRWIPNATYDQNESFVESVTAQSPDVVYANQENVRYDRSVGYYFDRKTYATGRLIWKPAVTEALVQIAYVGIPLLDTINDGDNVDIIELWIDLIVYGATIRGARRMKADKNITEIRLYALRDIIAELKPEYKEKLFDFHGIMVKETNTHTIIPWDFLNDRTMLRS
jgi:hypothetical protein